MTPEMESLRLSLIVEEIIKDIYFLECLFGIEIPAERLDILYA